MFAKNQLRSEKEDVPGIILLFLRQKFRVNLVLYCRSQKMENITFEERNWQLETYL